MGVQTVSQPCRSGSPHIERARGQPDRRGSPNVRIGPGDITRQVATLGTTAQNVLEVARFGGLETGEEPAEYEVAARGRIFRLRHYFPETPRAAGGATDPAGATAHAQRRGVGRVALRERGARPAQPGRGPLGDRLRSTRARGGRPRAHARRSRAGGLRRRGPPARGHRARRAPRRLLAGWDVLLPSRRLPPQPGAGQRDHLRQPGEPARRHAARHPRGGGRARRELHRGPGAARAGRPRLGDQGGLPAAGPREVPASASSTSCCSCATARHCCPARASGDS